MSSPIGSMIFLSVALVGCSVYAQAQSREFEQDALPQGRRLDALKERLGKSQDVQVRQTALARASLSVSDGPSPTWVRHYYTSDQPSRDSYSSMLVDCEGNVYAGGSTGGSLPPQPIALLAKYDANGIRQWLVRDTCDGGITALEWDSKGSVVAQGSYSLMKFTSGGKMQWRTEVRAPEVHPHVDQQGNIYLSYFGDDLGPLVKYSSEGTKLWSIDTTGLIAADSNGNVYMARPRGDGMLWYNEYTGAPIGEGKEIVLLKYDSTGAKKWEDHYVCGVRNFIESIILTGSDLTVRVSFLPAASTILGTALLRYSLDGSRKWTWVWADLGNGWQGLAVDCRGSSYFFGPQYNQTVSLRKIGSDGVDRWAVSEPGWGGSLAALDEEGNIVVSCWLEWGGAIWATAKYDTNGTRLWKTNSGRVLEYGGWGPEALSVSKAGKIFVMGRIGGVEYHVFQFSTNGDLNWELKFNTSGPSGYALDAVGSLYLIGDLDNEHPDDAVLRKIRADGKLDWIDVYDGPKVPGNSPAGFGLDASGNIYVLSDKPQAGFGIVKYDPGGNALWVKEGEPSYNPRMAVAPDGAVFVSRTIAKADTNDLTGGGLILDKFTPSGVRAWSVEYQPPANVDLIAASPLIDTSGSIYVVANRWGPGETSAILIQKFAQSGNMLWSRESAGSPPASGRHLHAITLDNKSNLLITCRDDLPNSNYVNSVIKFDLTGEALWTRTLVSTSAPWAITSDESGLVWVAGVVGSDSSRDGLVVIMYDSAGNQVWLKRDQGCGLYAGQTLQLVHDKNRSVFVVGTESDSSGVYCVTVSYDSLGGRRWLDRQPRSSGGSYEGEARASAIVFANVPPFPPRRPNVYAIVTVCPTGDLYVTCSDAGFLTTKYTNTGVRSWSSLFKEPHWAVQYIPTAMSLDRQGRLYVVGGSGGVVTTLRYDLGATGVQPLTPDLPLAYALFQNFPNPFNPMTTIRYGLPVRSQVTLAVFNTLGQQVAQLVNGEMEAGHHDVRFDGKNLSSGVYFYRIQAGSYVATKKLMMIR